MKKRRKARTEKQSWGPEVFWHDQQKHIAKDVWKEGIMLNELMGEVEIGRDDEQKNTRMSNEDAQ